MKISFVATVFNEEKTITALLDSLFKQTKMPDEIIIVDGGSLDSTLSRIFNFQFSIFNKNPKTKKIKFKVLSRSGLTIAQARNYGIKKASGDVIVMSDAGCILHKDWLEKITEPFDKKNADFVAGFYRMTGSTPLQKAIGVFLGIPPKRFDQNKFLPSARSMAFKKRLWKRIGGFDENLDRAGEDTLFNYRALKLGINFTRVKDALVDWEVPGSLLVAIKKFYVYAKGDVQAGIWWHPTQRVSTHNLKIASIFIRYFIGSMFIIVSIGYNWLLYIVFLGFLFYIIWSVWKMRDVVANIRARLWLPIVQIASDMAVISGTTLGLLENLWDTQKMR
ncbi:MAG: hypothetical protein A3D74_02125 [Candidatus Levybacteria bacterium RIFCSPHIGHO2_02_FULL_37_13]|nr:MAG: hypothetical protein A3D74_02125 [Candidatus Levybacteria bacterium RIFCSPHIGHO2_02_FULL_37_13]OGH29181.1 MAG: hypothetical protein A3E40_01505 [Candidatus Levybacteria bacterium RIFCSPHIGHO2_12_FULL_37_9]OGH38141.1 MAG: hypothetical protein A3B41_04330 [Candidatus Levybacteria bacterium RIFCSPLOWO2_01_FULL_37_26]